MCLRSLFLRWNRYSINRRTLSYSKRWKISISLQMNDRKTLIMQIKICNFAKNCSKGFIDKRSLFLVALMMLMIALQNFWKNFIQIIRPYLQKIPMSSYLNGRRSSFLLMFVNAWCMNVFRSLTILSRGAKSVVMNIMYRVRMPKNLFPYLFSNLSFKMSMINLNERSWGKSKGRTLKKGIAYWRS